MKYMYVVNSKGYPLKAPRMPLWMAMDYMDWCKKCDQYWIAQGHFTEDDDRAGTYSIERRPYCKELDEQGYTYKQWFKDMYGAKVRLKGARRMVKREARQELTGRKNLWHVLDYRGVKVLKAVANPYTDIKVEMTRKTDLKGRIIYGVVITNTRTGRYRRVMMFRRIADAYGIYKKAIA